MGKSLLTQCIILIKLLPMWKLDSDVRFVSTAFSVLCFAAPILVPRPAGAAITDPVAVVRAMEKSLEAAEKGEPPICPSSIQATDRYLFAFEGANGFCPVRALESFPSPERLDLPLDEFFEEIRYAYERYAGRSGKPTTEVLEKYRAARDVFFERRQNEKSEYLRKGRNCNLFRFMEYHLPLRNYLPSIVPQDQSMWNYREVSDNGHQKILYYAWDQVADAHACARSLVGMSERAKRRIEVSIVGYSFGGTAAAEFYENLPDSEYLSVGNILTIDPVPRAPLVVGSISGAPPTVSVSIRRPYRSWRNFFQRSDRKSLFITGIHGSILQPSVGTIRNTRVTPWALEKIGEGDKEAIHFGHVALGLQSEVAQSFKDLILPHRASAKRP